MDRRNDVGVGILSTGGSKLQPVRETKSKLIMMGRIFFFIISSVAFLEGTHLERLGAIG